MAETATRRRVLKTGAAVAALPLVHVRTAGAAGRLTLGWWDHPVPAGNEAMARLVQQWADRTKTDVVVDSITSVGSKNLLTIAAEAQAQAGHDALAFPAWEVHANARLLEPMDDVVERLVARHGPVTPLNRYLATVDGSWRAVPSVSGSHNKPSNVRASFFEQNGVDLRAMAPVGPEMGADYARWTWGLVLDLAPKAREAGLPFGLPLGRFNDAVDWTGSLFASFGAQLVDEDGNVTVNSDKVRQVLEWARKLVPALPGDVFSWDDASNNRALAAGQTALIFDPPSAWTAAVRSNPEIAGDCWYAPSPAGPAGRFLPYLPCFWGVWSFARNKQAAKDLIEWLSQREQAEVLCTATSGYDIPPFPSMADFPVWAEAEPPKGVVYHYPLRPQHRAQASIVAYPAPPVVAAQIYRRATMPQMIARCTRGGQSIEQVIAWAQGELEGFTR